MARSGVLFRVPFGMNTKLECRGGKMVFALAAMFAVFVVAGCSKAQPTSVLGDASHPAAERPPKDRFRTARGGGPVRRRSEIQTRARDVSRQSDFPAATGRGRQPLPEHQGNLHGCAAGSGPPESTFGVE